MRKKNERSTQKINQQAGTKKPTNRTLTSITCVEGFLTSQSVLAFVRKYYRMHVEMLPNRSYSNENFDITVSSFRCVDDDLLKQEKEVHENSCPKVVSGLCV